MFINKNPHSAKRENCGRIYWIDGQSFTNLISWNITLLCVFYIYELAVWHSFVILNRAGFHQNSISVLEQWVAQVVQTLGFSGCDWLGCHALRLHFREFCTDERTLGDTTATTRESEVNIGRFISSSFDYHQGYLTEFAVLRSSGAK